MRLTKFVLACAALAPLFAPPSAAAQIVGYPPEQSPFRDLEYRHDFTLFGGYFRAGKDPAGAAPRSAPMAGFRYEAAVGGPAALFGRFSYVMSERMVIDPTLPEAAREQGLRTWPLYVADVGVALNITGRKSYRRLVPIVTLGFGFASDASRTANEDPFRFGTTFALTYGLGLRVVPPGRWQVRLGLENFSYRLSYPSQYYTAASDGTSVVEAGQARSFWTTNTTLTLGGSLQFFR
jgi:hypothetical protein